MINLCILSKHLSSIGHIQCFAYPLSAMAPTEWEFVSDDNPWKASTFVSAVVELFLSILLLLGAAIAFITSRFVKFFGLEPPCTYIGCSHPLHFGSLRGPVYAASTTYKSNNLCTGEFCPDCHPSRIYSKLRANGGSSDDAEGSSKDGGQARNSFGSRDHNATQNDDVDASSGHLSIGGHGHEMHLSLCDNQCSCCNSHPYRRRNQCKSRKRKIFARVASSRNLNLNEDDLPLLSARSSSEDSGGFYAEDQCEISEVSANSEEEMAWKETRMKDDDVLHDDASFAHNRRREMFLENVNKKIHGVCAHSTEPSVLCTHDDEFEEPKVSTMMDNILELVSHRGAKLSESENQGLSHCNKLVQDANSNSNNGTSVGHPSSSSVNAQKPETISAPLEEPSVRESLNKKGKMFEACNEDTSPPAYIEEECSNRNNLDQDVRLLVELCSTEFDSNSVGTCVKSNDASRPEESAYVNNCKIDDRGLVNIGILSGGGNSQGAVSDEIVSEKEMRCSGELTSEKNLKQRAEDERTMYDDDCLGKGLAMASLASLDLSSHEVSGEGVKEACSEGADVPSEKDGRDLEAEEELCGIVVCNLEQEELFVKDHSRGVEGDVFGNAKESPDAPASLNSITKSSMQCFSLAHCGKSSKYMESMDLLVSADEDEGETIAEEGQEEGLDALKVALQAERSSLAALEAELENERNAAAVATSEAMAMISRLQEEKSAMQMEVAQLQRMSEEKADYDEQTMALLKEILFKRETENMALEKEVELYRERILEEKADGLKGNWFKEEAGSPSPQSLKRLLLAGEDEEFLSPIGAMNQQQTLASSSKFYQSGTRGSLSMPQRRPSMDMEELNAFSLDHKRSRDSPMSDKVVGMSSSKVWDDEGGDRGYWHGGFHGHHNSCEQLKKMGRSVFSTDDEEAQSILERLWMLEEELQELRGNDDNSGSQKLWSKAHEVQQLADSPTHRMADDFKKGEVQELDGIAGGFVPIHDVYEVHSTSNRSPPYTEEGDPLEGLQDMLRNSELSPVDNSVPGRMTRHRMQVPPRISHTRILPFSDEIPNTPTFMAPAACWKSSYPGSPCEHHDLSLVSREEKRMELEEIQQLAMRLKALEEDRELLRESLESFKRRDAELSLLQEIALHLRELRMAGFIGTSGGVLQEEVSITSPSKSRALKKRRYCSGPGQAQMHLLQQKSI